MDALQNDKNAWKIQKAHQPPQALLLSATSAKQDPSGQYCGFRSCKAADFEGVEQSILVDNRVGVGSWATAPFHPLSFHEHDSGVFGFADTSDYLLSVFTLPDPNFIELTLQFDSNDDLLPRVRSQLG